MRAMTTQALRFPRMLWRGVGIAALGLALAVPVEAVTVKEIIALSRAGVADDVLLALIETDGTIFSLDAGEILELSRSGVSERVVIAMLRSGRQSEVGSPAPVPSGAASAPAPASPAPSTETGPTLIIIGEQAPPQCRRPVFMAPVFVMPGIWPPASAQPAPPYRGFGRFINDGWIGGGADPESSPAVPAWGVLRRDLSGFPPR